MGGKCLITPCNAKVKESGAGESKNVFCFCCAFSVLHHNLEFMGSVGNAQKHHLRLEVLCQILLRMSPCSNKNSLFPACGTCPHATGCHRPGLQEMSPNQPTNNTRRGKAKHSSKLNASLVLWDSLLMLGQKW